MEEPLFGGSTSAAVVRVDSTVRRPTGPWTPGVHALLRHLESCGFDGAPRVLGIDERGREIVTYVEGLVVEPDHLELVAEDRPLAEISGRIRAYHDAVADFAPPDEQAWSDRGSDPRGPHEVLCHNDLAPWNLVRGSSGQWTFIDWDLAAPGRRSWDLAWAILSFVPLMPESKLTGEEIRRRITVFRDGYGVTLFPTDVLDVAVERCSHEAGRIHELGSRGHEPYRRLLAEGHGDIWASAEQHIRQRAPEWQAALEGRS